MFRQLGTLSPLLSLLLQDVQTAYHPVQTLKHMSVTLQLYFQNLLMVFKEITALDLNAVRCLSAFSTLGTSTLRYSEEPWD